MSFEKYKLANPALLPKPTDIGDYIAYNPSAIWTTESKSGKRHDIMYVRIEPDRSCSTSSHLGKSLARPYTFDINNFNKPLKPYYEAEEKMGEDPALTRINRRLGSGAIEKIWLLSCVDAQPFPDKLNQVKTLHTKFYAGKKLNTLEHIADGPEWMKDIRIAQDLGSTALHIYGRPQPKDCSGNITYTTIDSIEKLNAQVISEAPFIDETLFEIGSNTWGGVNDVITGPDPNVNILLAHSARITNESGNKVQYKSEILAHYLLEKTILRLGVLATANLFPKGTIKADDAKDCRDVVFSGGGYNGTLQYASFGVRDGSIGISRVQKLN